MNYGALRSELSTKHYNALTTKETKDKWKSTYGDERGWVSKCFADYDSASTLKGKLISLKVENPQSDDDFVKKYACDLSWAKDQEYCKTSPKQDEWVEMEEDNKTKFLQEFPCVASLIRGPGRQMNSNEGMIFALPITHEGDRCWVYMSENSQGDSKWDGLIKNLVNGKKGKFECEGGEIPSNNDNP
jgi:hypothetical protein